MHESPERTQAEWQALEAERQRGWEQAWHHMADADAHDEARYGELYREWQDESGDSTTPFAVWLDQYTPWDVD